MKVMVYRYQPGREEQPRYDEFTVDIGPEDRWTVMNLLEYIFEREDSTLAFYRHSACGHGICGRCAVRVNGKVKLACVTLLTGEDLVLEPANDRVVRDLVVKN